MFITAACVLFLIKINSVYENSLITHCSNFANHTLNVVENRPLRERSMS